MFKSLGRLLTTRGSNGELWSFLGQSDLTTDDVGLAGLK